MFKKLISLISLIILIGGAVFTYQVYHQYQVRRAERIAHLQQKAEEVSVTTIEGWDVKEIADLLEKAGLVKSKDFLAAAQKYDGSTLPLVQRPVKADLEGYLFPDTYRFTKTATAESIIDKMLTDFTSRLTAAGVTEYSDDIAIPGYAQLPVVGGDGKPGMSLYDVVTLASVIEKESGDIIQRHARPFHPHRLRAVVLIPG